MNFSCPWAFLLFIPLAVAAWRVCQSGRLRGALFADASRCFATCRTWRYWAARILPFLFLGGCGVLIVAAAGPRGVLSKEVKTSEALAVMMAVDISGSMRGLDLSEGGVEATRLDVVKQIFGRFVEQRPEDLIGLVTFGGYASVRSPLTADHRALGHTLRGVEIPGERNGLDEKGRPVTDDELLTAIGDGLAIALLRLQDAEPKTKIVILLSDGESNAGAVTPQEATHIAKERGVRVYTIGVGTTGYAKIRTTDYFGRSVLADAQMVLDEATLKQIAEETGGVYANVRSQEALKAALEQIAALEKTHVEREVYTRYRHYRKVWIGWGMLLVFGSAGMLWGLLRRPI